MKTLCAADGSVLATAPDFIQEEGDLVAEGGARYPLSVIGHGWKVLDGLPPGAPADYHWDGSDLVPIAPRAEQLQAQAHALIVSIDLQVDEIRNAAVGARATEYLDALTDAQAFQAAGYAGTVPAGVKSWQDAKNAVGIAWTATDAAQDILTAAAQLKGAQLAMRTARLLRKEQAKAAAAREDVAQGLAELQAATDAWTAFVMAIRTQLGLAPVT